MKVVIIGGTGHVGTYLIPRLVQNGFEVTNISRREQQPYQPHRAWDKVTQISLDRNATEADGSFGKQVADLDPDIVIDMICFTAESCQHLVESLRRRVQHFLHAGTIWVYGHSRVKPAPEDLPLNPFGDYGINKAKIETYLLKEARLNHFPATVLRIGHIVGPGWVPLNPVGNLDVTVFEGLARGEEVLMPNIGMETLHHVHADDIAQAFMKAISSRSVAIGEAFHVTSPAAMTFRGYAEEVAGWFGQQANLTFLPWDEYKERVGPDFAEQTWDHLAHSPNASIEKARRLLAYEPRYTSPQALYESVQWLVAQGRIRT